VVPWWRSEPYTNLHWRLDRASRENSIGRVGKRSKPGSDRHARLWTGRINEQAPAPGGLPCNCYREAFVNSLRPFELARLQMADRDYDW
ncbi:hypothetical protein OF83DRAFT_1017322, partial [Amylostereum chailletii]